MNKVYMVLFFLLSVIGVRAGEELYGYVYDDKGVTLPYASVFIQSRPSEGTVSDNNGMFVLRDMSFERGDTLVVSFIGFKTKYVPLRDIRYGEVQRIRLEEEMILLSEAVVFAKPIKNSRKRMRAILEQVKAQLYEDFPDDKNREYSIMSDYAIYSEGTEVVALEKAFGKITEIPNAAKDGMDSVHFSLDKSETFVNPDIKDYMAGIKDNEAIEENNKAIFKSIDIKTLPHQMLWGRDIKAFFETFDDEKIKRWEISHSENADLSILTYRDKKNYLGVFKYELKLNFIVDKYTYSIVRLSQELKVDINIPFGYKLDAQELDVLNGLSLRGEELEKFRVKKGSAHVVRDVKYESKGGGKHPVEKTAIFNMNFQDRKKKSFKWNSSAKIIVND